MKFALFFTNGTSLKLWEERGWLDGGVGIKSYNRWAEVFEKMYFITYGDKHDLQYGSSLRSNIIVLPKSWALPSFTYSFIVPWFYRRQLREVDIFFSAQMEGAWAAAIAKYLFRKKFVLRCGYQWGLSDFGPWFGGVKKIIIHSIERICYKAADLIIVTSDYAKKHVVSFYDISPDKIEVIPNPVDVDIFKPLPVSKTPNSLVYVGRLEKEKNLIMILKAIRSMDVNLTVIGRGSLERSLKDYAVEHNLRVTFRGNILNNQLPEELNKHEIFISSSLYENSPKALLEAMSCGMAVIGTDVRGINEIISHRENGYLCDFSPKAMREAILEVTSDSELRKRMGEGARQYILKHCDLDNKIDREMSIFRSLLSADESSS